MYGSGSLRGYGGGAQAATSTESTLTPEEQNQQQQTRLKEEQPRIYLPRNDNKSSFHSGGSRGLF